MSNDPRKSEDINSDMVEAVGGIARIALMLLFPFPSILISTQQKLHHPSIERWLGEASDALKICDHGLSKCSTNN